MISIISRKSSTRATDATVESRLRENFKSRGIERAASLLGVRTAQQNIVAAFFSAVQPSAIKAAQETTTQEAITSTTATSVVATSVIASVGTETQSVGGAAIMMSTMSTATRTTVTGSAVASSSTSQVKTTETQTHSHESSTSVLPSGTSTTGGTSARQSQTADSVAATPTETTSESGLSSGAKAGIAIGVIAILALILITVIIVFRKMAQRRRSLSMQTHPEMSKRPGIDGDNRPDTISEQRTASMWRASQPTIDFGHQHSINNVVNAAPTLHPASAPKTRTPEPKFTAHQERPLSPHAAEYINEISPHPDQPIGTALSSGAHAVRFALPNDSEDDLGPHDKRQESDKPKNTDADEAMLLEGRDEYQPQVPDRSAARRSTHWPGRSIQ